MKRVKFEWIIVLILIYTWVVSACMPERKKPEIVTYPTIPLSTENKEIEYDKSRITSVGEFTSNSTEVKRTEPDNGADDGDTTEDTGVSDESSTYDDAEPVSELVEPESISETELEGQLGEYSGDAETGYSDGFTDESEVAGSSGEYDDGGYSEPSEVAWSGEGGLTYLGQFTATAYCPCEICCGAYSSGYTASGTLATEGRTVACNSLPMGTQVMIDGNIYIVEDTGWSPYGENWIDIFFWNHDSALAYGMRTVDVYLVG